VVLGTRKKAVSAPKSLQINGAYLASGLLLKTKVTRTAKIRGEFVVALLVCLFLLIATSHHRSHSIRVNRATQNPQMAALPNLFFWAWERPEDLRFLESKNAGVAFLAKTIYVPTPDENTLKDAGGVLFVRPRLQPLRVAPGTTLIAVVRIETRAGRRPASYLSGNPQSSSRSTITPQQNRRLVGEIVDLQMLPNIRAIQIDFDATVSERSAYASLLKDLRHSLPASLPLSITALSSWCIGDPWLEQLPPGTIDEAVPMLFRMGPDTANVEKFLNSGNEFHVTACQTSLGLSTDEPPSNALLQRTLLNMPSVWHAKRIYVFAPRAWTQTAAKAVLKEWQP
jgi:hypothetical protein